MYQRSPVNVEQDKYKEKHTRHITVRPLKPRDKEKTWK